MLLSLIVRGPKCKFTKGTAQILLPTTISIVSASQARLSNYQKYWRIQVRNSHGILMETNESSWTLKARNLWWPIACRQSDRVQMYNKVPRSLIIKAFNSSNVFVQTWPMSQSFDLLIFDLLLCSGGLKGVAPAGPETHTCLRTRAWWFHHRPNWI